MIPSLLSQHFPFCLRQDRHKVLTLPLPTRHWGKHRSASVAFSSRQREKRGGFVRSLIGTTCHRIVLNVVSYTWWNWSMVILCHYRGIITSAELVDFSWLRLNFVLRRRCTHHTHALRDNSHSGTAAETSYQNTIQNSTLHQAVSHGGFQREKCTGFQRLLPSGPSHIHLLQTETAAKFSGPLTPDSLSRGVWANSC